MPPTLPGTVDAIVDLNHDNAIDMVKAVNDGIVAVIHKASESASFTGTTEIANILGQITTGITGFKASIDSDLLQKNAIPALVAKMRAARDTQLLKMQAAMINTVKNKPTGPTPLSEYSIEQGLIDLNAYYGAGTFVTALADITAKASEEEKTADDQAAKLKPNADLVNPTPAPSPKP
jgi:hypothetical protein